MQMHGHELHLPLHLDAYLHCVYTLARAPRDGTMAQVPMNFKVPSDTETVL